MVSQTEADLLEIARRARGGLIGKDEALQLLERTARSLATARVGLRQKQALIADLERRMRDAEE